MLIVRPLSCGQVGEGEGVACKTYHHESVRKTLERPTLIEKRRAWEVGEGRRGSKDDACPAPSGYIRARYNIGISCINLQAYREAAEHFVTVRMLTCVDKGLWLRAPPSLSFLRYFFKPLLPACICAQFPYVY